MSDLLDRLKKSSTIKAADVLEDSTFFDRAKVDTHVPMMNVALSGRLNGGFSCGLTVLAGASRMFKTTMALLCAKAYLDAYPDAVLMFYDSEFGSPKTYFTSLHIDLSRVLHVPVVDIEGLKFDLVNQLNGIKEGDHVFIVIDSIGNLASKKEAEDAMNQKSVADMSRAKSLKSLFRIVTPYLQMKDISLFAIAHTYMSMDFIPKAVVSGGQGSVFSANNVFIITRRQEKEGTELVGYDFTITVEKSRFVRERSKIPLTVTFDEGINPWSGLFDCAIELGWIEKPKQGWYNLKSRPDRLFRQKDTDSGEFWKPILEDEAFCKAVSDTYLLVKE